MENEDKLHYYSKMKVMTEIVVVPLHYLFLYHQYTIAFWSGLMALSVYLFATLNFHPAIACRIPAIVENDQDLA